MICHIMNWKKAVIFSVFLVVAVAAVLFSFTYSSCLPALASAQTEKKTDYIKYVEFNVPYAALDKALKIDISAHEKGSQRNWIELLAFLAAKYGGDFSHYKSTDMDALITKLDAGQTMEQLTKDSKYYSYYCKAYTAVLGGLVGEYKIQVPAKDNPSQVTWQEKYGLMAFSPIAKGYPFNQFDDFGTQRTYGYARQHLGHDLMAATGTPVIAVESGVVEALGWNQYGGWRIGIRSFDKQRYYYYAHLRQNRPYAANLAVGNTVKAGDVIGYVGHTGYSTKENANNIDVSHLHFGLQLIFDESQKECNNEIWVDVYPLTMLLDRNRSEVYKVEETKEYYRKYDIQINE